jgi:hypothetical protein
MEILWSKCERHRGLLEHNQSTVTPVSNRDLTDTKYQSGWERSAILSFRDAARLMSDSKSVRFRLPLSC